MTGEKEWLPKELRALRLLAEEAAQEEEGHPLKVLRPLVAAGLAIESPWVNQFHNRRWWRMRTVSLSDAGRRFVDQMNGRLP